jgi:hypothetical protein
MSIPVGIKDRMFLYSLKGLAVKLLLSDGPSSMILPDAETARQCHSP